MATDGGGGVDNQSSQGEGVGWTTNHYRERGWGGQPMTTGGGGGVDNQ